MLVEESRFLVRESDTCIYVEVLGMTGRLTTLCIATMN